MVIKAGELILRPLEIKDALSLAEILSDSTVSEMTVGIPFQMDIKKAETIILTRINWEKNGTGWQLGIEKNGRLIVIIGLNAIAKNHDRAAIDYIIGAEYRGKGHASEALRAFLPAAAERYSLHRISATVFADNIPSRRVLEKIGFAFEGISKEEIKKNGIYRDVARYGLIIGE